MSKEATVKVINGDVEVTSTSRVTLAPGQVAAVFVEYSAGQQAAILDEISRLSGEWSSANRERQWLFVARSLATNGRHAAAEMLRTILAFYDDETTK